MESESGLASKHGTCGAQEVECELIVNVGGVFVCCVVEGTEQGVCVGVRYGVKYALYSSAESKAGAEERVPCPTLCAGVHPLPILLVSPGDRDEFGSVQEHSVRMWEDAAVFITEDDIS